MLDPAPPRFDPGPEASCAVCGDRLRGVTHDCPRCETPHHPECWEYNEGCAVFGCKAALVVVREQAAVLIPDEAGTRPAGVDRTPALPALAHQLSLLEPAAWRLFAGLLLFSTIGLVASIATWRGFFGVVSLLLLVVPVVAVSLLAVADWLPSIFRELAQDGHPREIEETPLKRLEARLGEDPKNPNLLEMVAFGCYAQGRFEDALEVYERLLHLRPEGLRTAYQRARCLERLGRRPEAIRAFRSLVGTRVDEDLADKARFWLDLLERRPADREA